MKLLKSKGESFEFRFDSQTTIVVTAEGVIVSDIIAGTALERFAVTVSEVPAGEEVAEIPIIVAPVSETIPTIDPISDPLNTVENIIPNQ